MRRPVPAAEVVVDAALVRRLLASQHPDLAALPLRRIGSGWDNDVFRLGADLSVRLPRRAAAAALADNERRWLATIADRLPLPVPVPLRLGTPDAGYPWSWSVCRFVPGRPVGPQVLVGTAGLRAARDLAAFLAALHQPAPEAAPVNPYRGVGLAGRTEAFLRALPALDPRARRRAESTWQEAVAAPVHPGPAVWLHGDLHGLNVLARRGAVTGVVDFGDLCAGDPATDLAVAWLMLDAPGRAVLRAERGVDAACWQRGRGWGLYLAVMFLAHSAGAPGNQAIGAHGVAAALG